LTLIGPSICVKVESIFVLWGERNLCRIRHVCMPRDMTYTPILSQHWRAPEHTNIQTNLKYNFLFKKKPDSRGFLCQIGHQQHVMSCVNGITSLFGMNWRNSLVFY